MENQLHDIKRIVVKVGTSTITNSDGSLNKKAMLNLVGQIAKLKEKGYQVILVSSGAVGTGNGKLGIVKNYSMAQKQASAAIGQITLMNEYVDLFSKYDLLVGQILLTKVDIANRKNNLNARNTINQLLDFNAIPIINENDSTVVDEIKVGDNDNLSGLVAIMSDADLLIILSDIDGVYTDNPSTNPNAKFLKVIEKVTPTVLSYAMGKGSEFSVGGMITKLECAKKVNKAGIDMIIANGQKDNILLNILDNDYIGTLFLKSKDKIGAKKKFILLSSQSKGSITIDSGAAKALENHASLLAVGILSNQGHFDFGDVIDIIFDKQVIARGLSNYNSSQVSELKGKKLDETYDYETIVHKDNLVLVDKE